MDSKWDKLGIFLSGLCALHCLVTPFLIFSAPFLSYAFEHPLFHLALAVLVIPIGVFAFYRGYKAHHNIWVFLLGLLGLIFIGGLAFVPHAWLHILGHTQITLIGSVMLILAHLWNRQQCRCHP